MLASKMGFCTHIGRLTYNFSNQQLITSIHGIIISLGERNEIECE